MMGSINQIFLMHSKSSVRIYIVDNDPFCRNIYEQYLDNLGYSDITLFESGSACLNNLLRQPDVIFLDYGMDASMSHDILKKIKQFNPDIYVIFLSAQQDIEMVVKSLKHGAFDYIVKGANEMESIKKVLDKISEIQILLEKSDPGIFKRISFLN